MRHVWLISLVPGGCSPFSEVTLLTWASGGDRQFHVVSHLVRGQPLLPRPSQSREGTKGAGLRPKSPSNEVLQIESVIELLPSRSSAFPSGGGGGYLRLQASDRLLPDCFVNVHHSASAWRRIDDDFCPPNCAGSSKTSEAWRDFRGLQSAMPPNPLYCAKPTWDSLLARPDRHATGGAQINAFAGAQVLDPVDLHVIGALEALQLDGIA